MIRINDFSDKFRRELSLVCHGSPYGARIESYYNAYIGARYSFVEFWLCSCGDAPITAICRYYNSVIICGECGDEAENFVAMLSPHSVLTSAENKILINGFTRREGETMVYRPTSDILMPLLDKRFVLRRSEGDMLSLHDTYSLLSDVFSIGSPAPFDDYFVDMSHRVRHGVSDVYNVYWGDEPISTLSVFAISESAAVLGGIATKRTYQHQGIASAVLRSVTETLSEHGRCIFLHRERKIGIYEKCGFQPTGRWAQLDRQVK